MLSALSSCKTRTVVMTVPEIRTDTVMITKWQRDSIWAHDSVHVSEKTKGDTVWLEVSKWHTKYVEKQVHDTIYQAKRDSIPVPYEVIKEVPAKLSKTQKGLMTLGILTLMAAVIFGAFWLKKILRL